MKNLILVFFSFVISGCASRYLLPGPRLITPEAQGGDFKTSIELSKTTGHLLKLKGGYEYIEGVAYSDLPRTGYQLSTGLFERFDFIWSHQASANSLVGGKYQMLGSTRGGGTGSKLALAYLVGGNEHESDAKDIEFKLNAQEFWAIYGYRLNPMFMPYSSLSFGKYNYKAQIKRGYYQGEKPRIHSDLYSWMIGGELNIEGFFLKLETGFQLLESTKTRDKWASRTGFSAGYSW